VYDNAFYLNPTSGPFHKTVTQLNKPQTSQQRDKRPQPCRIIEFSPHKELSNPVINAVIALANETVRAGYGVLVFCSSRAGCEADAILISRVLSDVCELADDVVERRTELLNDLRSTPTGLDHILEKTIPRGVGFHYLLPSLQCNNLDHS
jgi:replicative superfamily II helicase